METILTVAVTFVTLFIQTTVFDFFAVGGIKPDLAMIVIIYFALFHELPATIGISLALGLFQDILSGGVIGLNILTKCLTGYLFSLIGHQIVVVNPINQALMVFLASLLNGGLTFLILKLTPLTTPGGNIWLRLILPQAVYNGLICLILIPLMVRLYKKRAPSR